MKFIIFLAAVAILVALSPACLPADNAPPDDAQNTLNLEAKKRFPELAERRQKLDKLHKLQMKLQLTLGTRARRLAQRRLPAVQRLLEKEFERLKRDYEKKMSPFQREKEKLDKKRQNLLPKIDKLERKGRSSARYNKELEQTENRLQELETTLELLQKIGLPPFSPNSSEDTLFLSLVKPTVYEEPILSQMMSQHPKIIELALNVKHLEADLAEAIKGENEKRASSRAIQRTKATIAKEKLKLLGMLDEILEDNTEQQKEAKAIKEKLARKLARYSGKRSGEKYETQMTALETRLETIADVLKLLNKFKTKFFEKKLALPAPAPPPPKPQK